MIRYFRLKFVSTAMILLMLTVCGCNSSWVTYALFTRPELRIRERYAVFGLDPEQEQIFMAEFIRVFGTRNATFVERQRIQGVISEQDFLMGRLKDTTRAKLQEIYGVEALIVCEYTFSQPDKAGQKKLRVRILDTETAAIIGSVVVSRTGSRQATQADFIKAVEEAIKGLREHSSQLAYY